MGYWYQSVGYHNFDAAWAPGMAYLTLDTDFGFAGTKPNVALTVGAFWPGFGAFPKYDTFTLGRFRQIGEQLKLTVPTSSDLTLTLVQGFGTGRDGSFNPNAPPFYGSVTSLDLLTWENVQLSYGKAFDVSLHYSTQWTADPNLTPQSMPDPKSYSEAQNAHLSVVGAEANFRAPYIGHLWISPSFVHVKNGWALANTGTEVMHSLGGAGVATNYLGLSNSPSDSTGSGSLFNLGFLYENNLSNLKGQEVGSSLPELTVSVFGLLMDATFDLPVGSTLPMQSLKQFKYGADATVQVLNWLGFMLRYDSVNYDLDAPGYIFAAITPRVIFSSHFMSSERIYVQLSHYVYGDKMVLNATWPQPWGQSLIAGASVFQALPYPGKTPDENVLKLQAEVTF
jgi:hypothetical protein